MTSLDEVWHAGEGSLRKSLGDRPLGKDPEIIEHMFRATAESDIVPEVDANLQKQDLKLVGPNFSLARCFFARTAARTSEGMEASMLFVAAAVPAVAIVILIHLAARLLVGAGEGEAAPKRD